MDPTVLVAIVATIGTLGVAAIGGYFALRTERAKIESRDERLESDSSRIRFRIDRESPVRQKKSYPGSSSPSNLELPLRAERSRYEGLTGKELEVDFLTDVELSRRSGDMLRFFTGRHDN